MKETDPPQEVSSGEDNCVSPIQFFLSKSSSHDSASLAGKSIANTSVESVGAHKPTKVTPAPEARELDGRPPLPQALKQEREDNPKPLVLNRDQSTGTAVSALTEISPEVSPTLVAGGHNRKISWDAGVLDSPPSDECLPSQVWPKPRKTDPNKVLSVADLSADSPLEAEAETSILKAIEDREENEPNALGSNLFTAIPENAEETFRMKRKASSELNSSTVRTRSGSQMGHQRNKTGLTGRRNNANLESTLFDLTNAMRDMHGQSEDASVIPEHEHCSDDQSLMNDAHVLFRRATLKKEKSTRNLAPSETIGTQYGPVDIDLERGENSGSSDGSSHSQDKKPRRCCKNIRLCGKKTEEDWTTFSDFMRPRRASIMLHLKSALFAFILPAFAVSLVLFYAFGNPDFKQGASISWLVLFLVRHSILYILAKLTQLIVIDLLALNTRCMVRVLGPFPSLCLVQSKGLPFLSSCWALYGILTLSGQNRFAKHWLFYQDFFLMCNEANPAGSITESRMNYAVLGCAFGLGIVATLKRVCLGLYFGKSNCAHFGDDVANVVRKILLVGEVASLAKDLELGMSMEHIQVCAAVLAFNKEANGNKGPTDCEEASGKSTSGLSFSGIMDKAARRDRYTGSITQSQRNELMSLLESWEEPETEKKAKTDDVSISAILQFRQALMMAANDFPFSMAFGLADTREHCIESSQKVYQRLLLRQPEEEGVLDFDTIALLATTEDDNVNREKMKELIRLFRPERDGTLTMVDFVKSIDAIYKQLRLLSASIANAGQIDNAAERIFNCIFYTVVAIVIVSILGFDPLAMFLSISSIIVAFAFMIGNASAKYFEGILFVLVRRPYSIGDRIHVSPVDEDTNPNGSSTWYVEHVDLFTTTVRFATTNEVATVSNGSLASSRVINAARSPKMLVYVYMKFGVDVPYQKVKLFRKTVEEFVKQRPRDWLSMCGFRATRVEHELGYIEYCMVLQHRERWQNVVMMLNAKAEFSSFALEVAKKLEMPYRAPSLPVDLSMGSAFVDRMKDAISAENNLKEMTARASDRTTPDMSDVAALFAAASV